MKRTGFEVFTIAVVGLIMSGLFTFAVADERKEISPTSRSDNSSTSQPASGVSSSPQPTLRTLVKPPEKLPGPEPINRQSLKKNSTPPPQTKDVLTGFCCKDGTLAQSQKADCSKKRGVFYTDKRKALAGCTGFCCKDGELQKTTKEVCLKKVRGKFFPDKNIALNSCKGWCCDKFEVSLTSSKQCTAKQGKFFGSRPEAKRFCAAQKGWCCVDGKIISLTQTQCKARKGIFYPTKRLAVSSCKERKSYCNVGGKTWHLTKDDCKKKKGSFFDNQIQAQKDLLINRRMQPEGIVKPGTKSDANKQALKMTPAVTSGAAAAHFQLAKPDLLPTRIWVDNQTCDLWVEWKNQGSAAPEKSFAERYALNGQFHHGSQSMTSYSFDSGQQYPISSSYKLNHPVTDLYPIKIDGPTQVTFTIDGTNVHLETNETNNEMTVSVNCLSAMTLVAPRSIMERVQPIEQSKDLSEGKGDLTLRKSNIKDTVKPPPPPPPPPNPGPNGDPPAPGIMMESALQGVAIEANLQGVIDLAITDISLNSHSQETSSVRLGKMFSYIATIKNIGIRNQSEDSSVAYFQLELTDSPYVNYHRNLIAPFTMALPPLQAGEEHTISNTVTIPRVLQNNPIHPGKYKFEAVINTSGYRPGEEANSGNNHFTKKFEVRDPQPADLALKSLTLSPDCRLRVSLKNEGASIDHEDFLLSHLRVEKGEEVYSGNSPDPLIRVVYDQIGLKKADPNGRLKQPGIFVPPTTYIWPAASTTSSNWSIDLGPGESAVYTVKVDPYNAIYDDQRENNTMTMNLTCPH